MVADVEISRSEDGAAPQLSAGLSVDEGSAREAAGGESSSEAPVAADRPQNESEISETARTSSPSVTPSAPEHMLEFGWQFWFRDSSQAQRKMKGGSSSKSNWEETLMTIGGPLKTVEGYWRHMNCILESFQSEKLPLAQATVFFFKHQVQPAWEDPKCTKGGALHIQFSGSNYTRAARQAFFLITMLMAGSCLTDLNDAMCGCSLGPKANLIRLELWVDNDDPATFDKLMSLLKKHLRDQSKLFQECSSRTDLTFEARSFRPGVDMKRGRVSEQLGDLCNI